MVRITGVISGTAEDAESAAWSHGIPVRVLHVLEDSTSVEFLATTPIVLDGRTWDEELYPVLNDWFAEQPMDPPFPIGALMVYSVHEDGVLPCEKVGCEVNHGSGSVARRA